MPPQGRLGDRASAPIDAHGCPACPHPTIGPAIAGSPTVMVNKRPALRVGDAGIHAACCGPNTWRAQRGCQTVVINAMAAYRLGDASQHCGGIGQLIEGSPNVVVGESTAGGGGGGGSSGSGSSSGGAGSGAGPAGQDQAQAQTRAALSSASERGAGLVQQDCTHCDGPTHIGPEHDPEAQRLDTEDDQRGGA